MKTLEEHDAKIQDIRAEMNKLDRKLGSAIKRRDALFQKQNNDAGNYESIEWLVNNPDRPGQYEAMREWLKEQFGGEHRGIAAFGHYRSNGQQSFSFNIDGWDQPGVAVPDHVLNIKKFADLVLPFLTPVQDDYVGFTYASGQFSGVFDIEYHFGEKAWKTSNTQYSRRKDVVDHDSLDDAIKFALAQIGRIDD